MRFLALRCLILAVGFLGITRLDAYPEFQKFIIKNSGKPVNCAFCHVHHDGPEGTAPGQIGNLSPAEQERLGRARAAFEPGAKPDSPILNRFGNHIIQSLGKKKFLELRMVPGELAKALQQNSDLDSDGIPDAKEYAQGTHPLEANDGDPFLLFQHNFKRYLPEILLTLAATVAGLYGLSHLLRGFAFATELTGQEEQNKELH